MPDCKKNKFSQYNNNLFVGTLNAELLARWQMLEVEV